MCNRSIILPCLVFTLAALSKGFSADTTPPTLDRITPSPNATVAELFQVEVLFSEEVQGVDVGDLRINNVPAANLVYGVVGQYIFEFPQPAGGVVTISWAANHGITDLAGNPFAGGSWSYTLDPSAAFFQVRINEFMADNQNGIRDEDGSRQDWIELYNAAATSVDLSGWYLTDNSQTLAGWRFPAGLQIPPNGYLLVWASGKNRTNNLDFLHTDFQLAKGGEFLALVLPDGHTIVSAFSPSYPPQQTDASYGRDRLDPNIVGYYNTPTPGAPNATGGLGSFASDVVYSRLSGTFDTPFSLSLSTASTNAVIRYVLITNLTAASSIATNIPTTNSPIYTNPIPISMTTQIRARAFEPGLFPSTPMTETYIEIASNLRSFSSDIPLVIVHNLGAGAPASTPGGGVIMLFDNTLDRSSLTNEPQVATRMGFHLRGSSTLGQAKSNYRLEYWDEFNQDKDLPFLNMPADSDWVLYGINGFDPGLMHNAIFYWLGRQLSSQFSSRTRYVEVFRKINAGPVTTNDYFGLYLAVESPKQGKDRVDIANLEVQHTNEPSITGGYMVKIDRTGALRNFTPPSVTAVPANKPAAVGGTPAPINYEEPKLQSGTLDPRRQLQANYFENYIRTFITNLAGPNFTDPVAGYAQYIDPDQWVDNLVVNIIPFNVDGYRLSGYLFKDRNDRLKQGPLWDCDRCLGTGGTTTPQSDNRCFNPRMWRGPVTSGDPDNGTDFFGMSTVGVNWFSRLFRDPDFWQKFIDHYQALRTNEFSTAAINAMIDGYYKEIREAQVREQARWGTLSANFTWPRSGSQTVSFSGTTYTYDFGPADNFSRGRFTNEVNFQKKWLADRLDFIDTNFLAMPVMTVGSSMVTNGTTVTVQPASQPGTIIYYTLDGTDPRLPGGGISPAAQSSAGNLTLTVSNNVRLFARCYNPNHYNLTNGPTEIGKPLTNSFWSGPVAATFYTHVPPLRITEIMYHPADAPPGILTNADNFEYLEFKNIDATPLNVNRFRLRGGVDFDFPNATLAAGEAAVIVRNLAAFQSRYGTGPRVLGVYTNDNLGNDGDHLVLEGSVHEPILDFNYHDDWYPATDGHGFSLQIVNDAAATDTWGLKASWRPSGVLGGTPSAPDPGPSGVATIYINEVSSHTDPLPADAIELYNPTGNAVNLGGWFLTDSFNTPKKYRIPDGTSISANGYLVFYQSNSFGTGTNGFALSSHGDDVYVFSADAAGNLTGWVHGYSFGPQANGVTFGRYLTSLGEDRFVAQSSPTLGAANSGPKVGPIVISEIYYHPPDFRRAQGLVDNDRDEYIELQNTSDTDVPLYDPLNPGNTWHLRNAVDFTFPVGTVLPAHSFAIVVGIDPADYRALGGVPTDTPIFGPWAGQLDNSKDSVELARPDQPEPPGSPSAGLVSYILVDKVEYQDSPPWPSGLPDGFGGSLSRIDLAAYGDDPTNWLAGPRTPGAPLPTGGTPPVIVTQPVDTTGIEGQSASFTLAATGSGLGYIWTFNGDVLPSAPSLPTLTLSGLNRAVHAGTYACIVFNSAGSAQSSNATLRVRLLPRVTLDPTNQAVWIKPDPRAAQSTNVTFVVGASSEEPPILYQWRFNGTNIPGATGSSIVVTNVQVENEGDYDCTVRDGVATIFSGSAHLTPLVQPIVIQPPLGQTVVEGSDFSQSVEIIGHPPPFGYSWRRALPSGTIVSNYVNVRSNFITVNSTTAGLVLASGMTSSNYELRLVIFNAANLTPGILVRFTNTVVADFDRDGIPDTVETALGLNPTNPADGGADLDGDGMSNRDEYIAGTDPTNPASYLKINSITAGGGATLTFGAVSNKTYTIQYTERLGGGVWTKLKDIFARSTNRTETVFDPNFTTNRYYRVATPAVP